MLILQDVGDRGIIVADLFDASAEKDSRAEPVQASTSEMNDHNHQH
jgi:hypothetical protein